MVDAKPEVSMLQLYSSQCAESSTLPQLLHLNECRSLGFWITLFQDRGFHRPSTTSSARRKRTLNPPDNWSYPIWECICSDLRPFLSELVMSTGYLSFEHRLVLLFCFFKLWLIKCVSCGIWHMRIQQNKSKLCMCLIHVQNQYLMEHVINNIFLLFYFQCSFCNYYIHLLYILSSFIVI